MNDKPLRSPVDRRRFVAICSGLGLAGTALPQLLWAWYQDAGKITKDMLDEAEAIIGLEFTDDDREMMLRGLNRNLASYEQLRKVEIPNSVHPAVAFDPMLPGRQYPTEPRRVRVTRPQVTRPADLESLAFASITELAELIRTRQVTSVELTRMYLDRLTRFGPTLECVVTLTDDLAMKQARRADADLAHGVYRGPLHGIPWGAKDLLAEDAYRTTWGAKPYETQIIDVDATVDTRLEEAGAVLVAKLTLGALAQGDVWFGGTTKNPWKLDQGSSGSSAGPASATVAGLVGFSIGSETLGSIVSPSTRCGASGLRPTFGRVSRYGAMALSWTMDKLGPICRSAEDCALVLDAIQGADGKDPTARTVAFDFDPGRPLSTLRIGYLQSAFEADREDQESKQFDLETLNVLRAQGATLQPIELPSDDDAPIGALRIILSAEAAAAFDDLTRSGRDDLLVNQRASAWPTTFRTSRLIPAVEYIQANRVRTMVMGMMESRMEGFDLFVTPSFGGNVLLLTNLTGHPAAVVPNGYRKDGTPTSISFIGKLFGDAEALTAAKAYQDATDFHKRHPPRFT
jgi:Asp-tRNA(Asn)/Glu-tRNA(Gln) amidotransferase A subunit family amidase